MEIFDSLIEEMGNNPKDVRYTDLCKVCDHFFGESRQKGTSHRIYKTPWIGDPRVNIQKGKGGKAKAYQVNQVLEAIAKWKAQEAKKPSTPKRHK